MLSVQQGTYVMLFCSVQHHLWTFTGDILLFRLHTAHQGLPWR